MTPDTDEDAEIDAAEERLQEEIAFYDREDPTGQDGEEAINQAAADLIAARDRKLRHSDPELYNEQRQMGMLE